MRFYSFFACFAVLFLLLASPAFAQANLPGGGSAVCNKASVDFPAYQNSRIEFEFETARPCGQFVDGSYWVTAPVTIKRITPDFIAGNNNGRHGWAVDPDHYQNFFDGRAGGYNTPNKDLPITIDAAPKPVSIVKTNSNITCNPSCLTSAAILTVVAKPPANYSFRPPYVAGDKPIYTLAQLDLKSLPKLSPLPQMPRAADIGAAFKGPWLELGLPQSAANLLRPAANFSGKTGGIAISNHIASAALISLHNTPIDQRLPAIAGLVQYGIDQYHLLRNGRNWTAQADKNPGHKLPILIAGRLLKIAGLYNIGYTHLEFGPTLQNGQKANSYFQEDGHTFIGENNEALFGATYGLIGGKFGGRGAYGYDMYMQGNCRNGPSDLRDPDGKRDGGAINDGREQIADNNGNYTCAPMPTLSQQRDAGQAFGNTSLDDVARVYVATATAARLWGLEKVWNWPAFFRFAERWNGAPWNNAGGNANPYAEMMHGLYYADNKNGLVSALVLSGDKTPAAIVWKPIPGLKDDIVLPGPENMMRQILDIMYHGGSIQALAGFSGEE